MKDDIEVLMASANAGEPGALDRLFELLYPELRQLARSRLREGGRNLMLDTTALVHEAYLRFVQSGALRSDGRRAFFAYASRVMRSVIVDAAREVNAQRRGGDIRHLTLDTRLIDELPGQDNDLLHIDQALRLLADSGFGGELFTSGPVVHRFGDGPPRRSGVPQA